MKVLRKAILDNNCLLNLKASGIEEIIRAGGEFLVQTGRLTETQREEIVKGLLDRERESPTAIGHAFAIPHYYHNSIDEPIMVFVRLNHPINLGAPDGVATRFIFLLIGPENAVSQHLDALASIARLMSDDEFHYEATSAKTKQAIIEAIDRHTNRLSPTLSPKTPAKKIQVEPARKPFQGLKQDIARRLPHYADDFKQGFQKKCAGSIFFMFFACLAPAVTFGGIMGVATGGAIGPVEMLVASAGCGILYAIFAGQPLIILGGIGPLLIFTIILYRLCGDFDVAQHFLSIYGWVGLWTGFFTVVLAVTNASNLMRFFTRFTDEIFSALMSLIFIYEAFKAIVHIFQDSFADPNGSHDAAFLTLLLALGTLYIAMSLSRFRRSHFLSPNMREFLADFGPTIALVLMAMVAWLLRDKVGLATLNVNPGFKTTSGRPWVVDLFSAPKWIWFAAAAPALLATLLIYLSQNITSRLLNNPENKLKKGESYHLDLAVVGILIACCSFFGLPWLVAATVRSLAHVRALATSEEVTSKNGASKDRIIHVTENRITALAIHILLAASIFWLEKLKLIPMATLYGIFLYMGFVSLLGNQFMERLSLWLTDSNLYPSTHYTRRVRHRIIHLYTLLQFVCLAVLCAINVNKSELVRILFPVFIALLVPMRYLANHFFKASDLEILDADEAPEEEASHWF